MLYSAKDIYNRVMNLKKRVCDGGILEKYLMGIQQEGGTVNWTKADSGEILVLYIQTKAMYTEYRCAEDQAFCVADGHYVQHKQVM